LRPIVHGAPVVIRSSNHVATPRPRFLTAARMRQLSHRGSCWPTPAILSSAVFRSTLLERGHHSAPLGHDLRQTRCVYLFLACPAQSIFLRQCDLPDAAASRSVPVLQRFICGTCFICCSNVAWSPNLVACGTVTDTTVVGCLPRRKPPAVLGQFTCDEPTSWVLFERPLNIRSGTQEWDSGNLSDSLVRVPSGLIVIIDPLFMRGF
jgi:hypothetical protein